MRDMPPPVGLLLRGKSMNVIEIDARPTNGVGKISENRKSYVPADRGQIKVYIIDLIAYASAQAF